MPMDHYDTVTSTPHEEPCAQLGRAGYEARARLECRALIGQLRRELGEPPDGSYFRLAGNPHDFGTYYTVRYHYDPADAAHRAYMHRLDDGLPARWDGPARDELLSAGVDPDHEGARAQS